MEFSKKLMVFFCIIIALAFFVAVFSWLAWREIPSELLAWVTGFIGAGGLPYLVKSCVENKAKIEKSHLDKLNGRDSNEHWNKQQKH
jgi:hypothetical protein